MHAVVELSAVALMQDGQSSAGLVCRRWTDVHGTQTLQRTVASTNTAASSDELLSGHFAASAKTSAAVRLRKIMTCCQFERVRDRMAQGSHFLECQGILF